MGLLPDFRKEEQRVEKLVRMGTTNEKDSSLTRDVEGTSRSKYHPEVSEVHPRTQSEIVTGFHGRKC